MFLSTCDLKGVKMPTQRIEEIAQATFELETHGLEPINGENVVFTFNQFFTMVSLSFELGEIDWEQIRFIDSLYYKHDRNTLLLYGTTVVNLGRKYLRLSLTPNKWYRQDLKLIINFYDSGYITGSITVDDVYQDNTFYDFIKSKYPQESREHGESSDELSDENDEDDEDEDDDGDVWTVDDIKKDDNDDDNNDDNDYMSKCIMSSDCSVCHESLFEGDTGIIKNCGHIFHIKCISDYKQNGGHQCPLCRKPFQLGLMQWRHQ